VASVGFAHGHEGVVPLISISQGLSTQPLPRTPAGGRAGAATPWDKTRDFKSRVSFTPKRVCLRGTRIVEGFLERTLKTMDQNPLRREYLFSRVGNFEVADVRAGQRTLRVSWTKGVLPKGTVVVAPVKATGELDTSVSVQGYRCQNATTGIGPWIVTGVELNQLIAHFESEARALDSKAAVETRETWKTVAKVVAVIFVALIVFEAARSHKGAPEKSGVAAESLRQANLSVMYK